MLVHIARFDTWGPRPSSSFVGLKQSISNTIWKDMSMKLSDHFSIRKFSFKLSDHKHIFSNGVTYANSYAVYLRLCTRFYSQWHGEK